VALLGASGFVIAAPGNLNVANLADYVKLVKSKPGQFNYASAGHGSATHMGMAYFLAQAGLDMQHIPFKGAAPLKQEMLAGRLQIGGDQLSTSLAEIRSGTIKALATTASKRMATLPNVPTVRELGYPSLELEGWNGLFAPAKTPRDIIDRLQREVVAAVRHPDVVKRLTDMGADPVGSSPEEQLAMFKNQMDQFRSVIREMKIDQ
jgi:tripartite-type tricarboxylate transporter receptor subunit TctC